MFQPKYTMNGHELKEEPKANSPGFSRVLRTLLTSKLHMLHSAIQHRVSEEFARELSKHEEFTGMATPKPSGVRRAKLHPTPTEWQSVRMFSLAKRVVTRANSCVFFGDDSG